MATKNFKILDRVKIIFSTYDRDGNEGAYGTIVKKGVMHYDWIVRVEFPARYDVYQDAPANAMGKLPPPPTEELGFNSDELELVELVETEDGEQ